MAHTRSESERTPVGQLLHTAEQCAQMSGDYGVSGQIAVTVALVQVLEEIRDEMKQMHQMLESIIGYENYPTVDGDVGTYWFLNMREVGR